MGWKNTLVLPQWYSEKRVLKLIDHDKQEQEVNIYRNALSLFVEILLDEKLGGILETFDGRDAAGKGYTPRELGKYVNASVFDVVAQKIPTNWERMAGNWFKRYERELPQKWEIVCFDRSWYNRAIVEPVMGFCTEEQYERFMAEVIAFEKRIKREYGIKLIKIYLSIDKKTQAQRLEERQQIMRRWKSSKVDAEAQQKWWEYTYAKLRLLEQTDAPESPWYVVDSTVRYLAVIESIKLIILAHPKVAKFIEDELRIDLSLNSEVTRTGEQELKRMKQKWQDGKPFGWGR